MRHDLSMKSNRSYGGSGHRGAVQMDQNRSDTIMTMLRSAGAKKRANRMKFVRARRRGTLTPPSN